MIKQTVISAVALLALPWAAPAAESNDNPPPRHNRIRVLLVTGGHDFDRDEFMAMFQAQPDVVVREVVQPEAQKWFDPGKADQYDVMVWYDLWQQIDERNRTNLLTLLERGKPLLVLHHAVANYQEWPEALQIIGGRYHLEATADHPASAARNDQTYDVKIADRVHPIARPLSDFQLHDEVYNQCEILPEVKPLLTTDHPRSDKIIGWTHTYKASPVVYIMPGHGPEAFRHPVYRTLLAQSIRWLAGALPDPSEEGFVPLFNGRDLDGWTRMGDPTGWEVRDGVLFSGIGNIPGWLRTDRVYGDFILRLQWRVSQNGNSGVFIRATTTGHPWISGSEVQISNEPRDPIHCTGALYDIVPVNPRPDESAEVWHDFEIHCHGPYHKVFANNIPIIDVDARQVPDLFARPTRGYIGLQSSHAPEGWIEFRNIRIKELPPMTSDRPDWPLAMQAWTFNHLSLHETIEMCKSLGIKYLEAYPGQSLSPEHPDVRFDENCPPQRLAETKMFLHEAGVQLVNFGVVGMKNDEAQVRKLFDFALTMGIETLTAEPDLDAFPLLDKLTKEYDLKVAIHNHPRRADRPDYRYWDPHFVLEHIKPYNRRIGVCADTGHWARSGVKPVEALRTLKGRIISLHMKDIDKFDPDGVDVPWGTGACDFKGMLEELKRQDFKGVIAVEYENKAGDLVKEVRQCIEAFNRFVKP